MAYNNSHSVMLGQISSYLDRCCRNAYEQGRADAIKTIDEELKEVRHCLELAKEQMLIDYVYIACEHLDNIEKLKEQI